MEPKLKRQRVDPLEADSIGYTPLMSACEEGDQDTVDELVRKQPDSVHTQNKEGKTALWIASAHGYVRIVRILTKHTPLNLEKVDSNGTTALFAAAERGHMQVVDLLCALGANVEHMDNDLKTPLYAAAVRGHRGVVEILHRNGATLIRADGKISTLAVACIRNRVEIVQFFLEHTKEDASHCVGGGDTLLHLAAKYGLVPMVAYLLSSNPPEGLLDARNAAGATPLWLAARNGRSPVIKMLLSHGVNINARHAGGTTPLVAASARRHVSAVRCLAAAGADLREMREIENLVTNSVLEALLLGCRDRLLPIMRPLVHEALLKPRGLPKDLLSLVLDYAMPSSFQEAVNSSCCPDHFRLSTRLFNPQK